MKNSTRVSLIIGAAFLLAAALNAGDRSLLSTLPHIQTVASTVPANGDVNPYGVAIVPVTTGALVAGNVLVSNFNNSANLQGTGTTIVQISPEGVLTPFAELSAASLPGACPGGVGLTTALVALHSGFVVVGSLPTADGTSATAQAGCLIVLNSSGVPVATISGNGINGPWDMTAFEMGSTAVLFVCNVLNGTVAANGAVVNQGSVLRFVLSTAGGVSASSFTTIASAFPERTDPAALVIGPTGLGLGSDGTLFVADTLRSRIASISDALFRTSDAGAGETVAQGGALKMPLGLAIVPTNGNILTVNAGTALMVETTPDGKRAGVRKVDVSHSPMGGAGTLFGLAVKPDGSGVYYVDDGNNTLNILQ